MFKVGDKIVRKASYIDTKWGIGYCGKVCTVTKCNEGTVFYTCGAGEGDGYTYKFELYEEKLAFNLKTMPWKILVNSPEESRMAQEWLFKQGVEWKLHGKKVKELNVQVFTNCRASDLKPEPNLLYSYDAKNSVAPEIKLTFGVTSVEYPEPIAKETEAQKKMKELEDKQREISEELAKLRESM